MKKKSKPTPKYDSTREQNVLLEKMHSEIKAISEGHASLSEKINEMDKTLQEFNSTSCKIEMDVQSIKSKTGAIDIKTDRIERELEVVKVAVLENSKDIKQLAVDHEDRLKKLEAIS